MTLRENAIETGSLPGARRIAIVLALLILGVEGSFYHYSGWNQHARLDAAIAFVEPGTPYTGTFRIDGLKDDVSRLPTGDWAQSNGAFYSNKAPGTTFLGVLPYFALYYSERAAGYDPKTSELTRFNVWALNLWISVFWTIVAALALMRWLPRLGVQSPRGAVVVALTYSCATLVLPYACSTWGHSTAAAFITLGTLNLAEDSRRHCAVAGFWLGMAVLTEYLAALSLVLAGLYVVSGDDPLGRLWRFVCASAVPIAALLLYQQLAFGNFLTTAPSLSNPIFLQPGRVAGLFGLPNGANLAHMLFLPGRGLFWQAPVLLAFVVGAVSWYRSKPRRLLVLALANIVLYALSISTMDGYGGGLTTSMRYMIIALPFFCLLLPDVPASGGRKTFLVLFAISAANMFVLAATTTMYPTEFPLSKYAYPEFLAGMAGFNQLFRRLGVVGRIPEFAIALTYALGVVWILRSVLVSPRPVAESYAADPAGS